MRASVYLFGVDALLHYPASDGFFLFSQIVGIGARGETVPFGYYFLLGGAGFGFGGALEHPFPLLPPFTLDGLL